MKMITIALVIVLAVLLLGAAFWARRTFSASAQLAPRSDAPSLYSLRTESLDGQPVDLGSYRGQVALVVNTASKCGLTPQYEGLEALYRELSPRGFVVLGFPSNDFMGQEPGSADEIRGFCKTQYDVTFPLFAKSRVKGDQRSPVYRLLTADLDEPTWNFTKYLIDRSGRVLARFGPRTAPADPALRQAIEDALQAE